MPTFQTEFANAVASYQTTIDNARTSTGSYYSISTGYFGGGVGAYNPYDIEVLDDGSVKTTFLDGNGNPTAFQYGGSPDFFTLNDPETPPGG